MADITTKDTNRLSPLPSSSSLSYVRENKKEEGRDRRNHHRTHLPRIKNTSMVNSRGEDSMGRRVHH
jgi:hypothetical protein